LGSDPSPTGIGEFIRSGIKGIHDADGYGEVSETIRIMQQAIKAEEVKVRVYAMIGSLTNSRAHL
jgi:predicted amidohydrolase YtcJ